MSTLKNIHSLSEAEKEVLKELKDTLTGFLGTRLVKLVIFGSKARGNEETESDIDVAIIVRGLNREMKDQILDRVVEIEFKKFIPISTLIISEADFLTLKERERRIAFDIERDGIAL